MITFGTILQMCSNFLTAVLLLLSATAVYNMFILRFTESDRIWGWAIKLIPFFLAVKVWQFVDYAVITYRWGTHGSLNSVQEWMLTLAIFALLACLCFICCLIYQVFQFFFGKERLSATVLNKIGFLGGSVVVSGVSALFLAYFMTVFS